ncbi:Ankyrin repeat domain-containing protein 16 [Rhizophlyctis rosea]|nr:Ankyrin repeat domain-containing protein 16 [Rhizophlyctis rosea]
MTTPMALLPEILQKVSLLCDPPTTRALRSTFKTVRKHITEKDVVLAEANWRLSERSVQNLAEWAARKWHRDILWWCLTENGMEWMRSPERLNYLLVAATKEEDMEIVKFLLDTWPDMVVDESDGMPFLKPMPSMINMNHGKVLITATRTGNLELVKFLVGRGAQITETLNLEEDTGQGTALDEAAKCGHTDIVRYLLGLEESLFNIFLVNPDLALYHAAYHGDMEMLQLFRDAGVNARSRGHEALICAAEKGHLTMVQTLLENGMDGTSWYTSQALYVAVAKQHWSVVTALLDAGAYVEWNSVLAAASIGQADVLRELLEMSPGSDVKETYTYLCARFLKCMEWKLWEEEEKGAYRVVKEFMDANKSQFRMIREAMQGLQKRGKLYEI